MRFDITDLRLFLNIYKAGSITGGANLSHLSLQSASERIRGMESELGVLLFTRTKVGVTLTNAGLSLVNHANTVLQQIEHMRSELQQYSKGLRGHIHLLANSSGQTEFLPHKIGRYLHQQPNISLSVTEMPSTKIVSNINNQMADLGIVADSTALNGLDHRTLCDDPLIVFVPLASPWTKWDSVSFSDIVNSEFVGLTEGIALQDHLDEHAKSLGTRLNYRVRMATVDGIMQVVSQGGGLAIIPQQSALRFIGNYQGKLISLSDTWAKRKLVICARNFDQLPNYVTEFIDFLFE
ncbi:LysR substrate-binding domain-containing protein [Providencia burhodogranariea]|uniref:LysR family transcriptional regulator n=1 Tax=Providencia burhodogranariea DSM 19968 TaxID=1141662 RepID=K8WR48_9GAMM|nr:LysR substrate-binding domain-containing protein [Providencia burhodogranariea]EKT62421.1 LysR family transcriptional regulator [Providencia burhodogranariea DSM 19968]